MKGLWSSLPPPKPACRVEVLGQQGQEKKTKDYQLLSPIHSGASRAEVSLQEKWAYHPFPSSGTGLYPEEETECKNGIFTKEDWLYLEYSMEEFVPTVIVKTVAIFMVSN